MWKVTYLGILGNGMRLNLKNEAYKNLVRRLTVCHIFAIGENCRNTDISAIRIIIPINESQFLPEKST